MLTSRDTGVAVIEVLTTADRLIVEDFRRSETGSLRAMSVVVTVGNPEVGQLFVEAGVMRSRAGEAYKVAVLVQDYSYVGNVARWYGELPLDPDDILYLQVRGAGVYTVRLNALVEIEREV